MFTFLKKHSRRLTDGWFWAAALLILPACSFSSPSASPGLNLPKGPDPHDSAIFCDIEKTDGRRCATPLDKAVGIRFSEAAVALAEGRTSDVGLDDSPAALARCGGEPEAVLFEGPFPQGLPVCLNCSSIATNFGGDNKAACRAACYDLYGPVDAQGNVVPDNPPTAEVQAFCDATARPSANFPLTGCYGGACAPEGVVNPEFADPRRIAEPVVWQNLIGVAAGGGLGNDLTRTAPTSGSFDAGAVSAQWITRGDAYVEFSASRNDQTHPLGLSEILAGCPAPCPEIDPSLASLDFGIGLGNDGKVYVFKSGVVLTTVGPYVAGQRFRVRLRDNGNGSGTVSLARVEGSCVPGTVCNQTTLYTFTPTATYPLRVDTSSFEQGATLVDVRLVRIQ